MHQIGRVGLRLREWPCLFGVCMSNKKVAQTTLVSWLRGKARLVGDGNDVEWGNLSWRVNRPGPYYGVYDNYPITIDFPMNVDECVEGVDIAEPIPHRLFEFDFTKPLWESVNGSSYADIAISHKGVIHSVIFIDNGPTLEDIHDTSIWLCSSQEILTCRRTPKAFPGILLYDV